MMQDLAGSKLGAYTLSRKIGEGGMGAVYESFQTSMKRKVAVKVLPTHLAQEYGYLERFNREVELAAHLEHPHILPVHEYGSENGISYIVMRLLSGGSLEQRLREKGRPSFKEALQILGQIASALDYAHRQGVVHRDIKPSNVLFDTEGNVYLTDFGIAKVLEGRTGLTGTGQIMGTPAYMSPEQWRADPVDARTDIYALGILAYNLMTGKMPFDAPTPYAMMHKHLNEMPTPPSTVIPELPQGINAVLAKAIAKNPDERYSTCQQFVEALQGALSGLPAQGKTGFFEAVTVREMPTPNRAASPPRTNPAPTKAAALEASQPTVMVTGGSARRGSSGWLVIGGVVVVAVIMGVAALFLLRDDDEPSQATENTAEVTEEVIAVVPTETPTRLRPTITNTPSDVPSETPRPPTATHTRTPRPTATATPTEIPPTLTSTPELQTRIALFATQTATLFTPTDTPDVAATETIELGFFYATQTASVWTNTPAPSKTSTQTSTPSPTATFTITPSQTPSATSTSSPSPTRTLTLAPTLTPVPSLTKTVTPSPGCVNNGLPPRLTINQRAWVLPVPPEANALRDGVGFGTRRIGWIQPAEAFDVLEGPVCANDVNWWLVQLDNGDVGWTAEGDEGYYWIAPVGVNSNLPDGGMYTGATATVNPALCPAAPALRFSLGQSAVVYLTTAGDSLLITSSSTGGSGGTADTIARAYDNEVLLILDGPVCGASGNRWRWKVRQLSTGIEGWVSEGVPGDPWMCPVSDPECG